MFERGVVVKGCMARNIVISSSGRKLGKTLLGCSIARLLTDSGLAISCVKLSRGAHVEPGLHEGPGRRDSDTDRFSRSGAARVSLFAYRDPSELPAVLDALAGGTDVVVWESGTVRRFVEPDVHVHIRAEREDPEPPEPGAPVPGMVVRGPLDPDGSDRIARLVGGMLELPLPSPFTVGGKHWLSLDGHPLFGEGRIGLLRAIRDSGSILAAAGIAGIPYKRAWVLLREAEERLGADLVHSGRGGVGGGGTRLTVFGEWLLELWDRSERGFREMLERLEAR